MIDYLDIRDTVLAAHWDALYAEADGKLAAFHSNHSILLWTTAEDFGFFSLEAMRYERRFYFIPSLPPFGPTDPAGSLTSLWQVFIWSEWLGGATTNPWFRKYDHTTFATYAAGAALYTPSGGDPRPVVDLGYACAIIVPPGGTYVTDVWPDTPSVSGTDLASLRYSLEAHKRTIGGHDYFLYVNATEEPEHTEMWKPIEVVLGGQGATFTWPKNYNRYRFIRFNNLGPGAITVTLKGDPDVAIVIAERESKCARRAEASGVVSWTAGYRYFHKMQAGDPWWLRPAGGEYSNVTDALVANYMLPNILSGVPKVRVREAWDTAAIYTDPDYHPGTFEMPVPTGGYYKAISGTTKLGDLAFSHGSILVVNPGGQIILQGISSMVVDDSVPHIFRAKDGTVAVDVNESTVIVLKDNVEIAAVDNWGTAEADGITTITFTVGTDLSVGDTVIVWFKYKSPAEKWWIEFTGMDALAEMLQEVGLTLVNPSPTVGNEHGFQIAGEGLTGDGLDLIPTRASLLEVGTFGPFVAMNVQPGAPLELRGITVNLPDCNVDTDLVDTTVTWYDWTYAGGVGAAEPDLTIHNTTRQRGGMVALPAFSFFDTWQDLQDAITAAYPDTDGPPTVTLEFKVFGPVIGLSQALPLDYPASGFEWTPDYIADTVAKEWQREFQAPLGSLDLTGGDAWWNFYRIDLGTYQDAWGWPMFGTKQGMEWNNPRVNHCWMNRRSFTHDPATEGFAQSTGGGWPPYNTSEEPLAKNFYEEPPLPGPDRVVKGDLLPVANVFRKQMVALMGAFPAAKYDLYTRLSAWSTYGRLQTSAGTLDYSKGSTLQASYYPDMRAYLLGGTTNIDDAVGQNVLPLEVEHFNAVASAVNSVAGTLAEFPRTYLTMFAPPYLAQLLISLGLFNGIGRGFGSDPTLGGAAGPLNIRPRNLWASWDTAANPGVEAVLAGLGITAKTQADFPSPWPDLATTNTTWIGGVVLEEPPGSGTFVPHYYTTPTENRPGVSTDPVPLIEEWMGTYFLNIQAGEGHTGTWDNTTSYLDGQTVDDGVSLYYMAIAPSLNKNPATEPTFWQLKSGKPRACFDGFFRRFRWLTIAQGQALCAAVGLPFILNDVSVPGEFLIEDAGVAEMDRHATEVVLLYQWLPVRMFGWTNDANGLWVFDSDAVNERGNHIIRNLTPITEKMWALLVDPTVGTPGDETVCLNLNFGDLLNRLYEAYAYTFPPGLHETQKIVGNNTYLYRRYGTPAATAVIWPRNYASWYGQWVDGYERAVGVMSTGVSWRIIPRSEQNGLEGADPEIVALTAEETLIQTSFGYAEMQIYPTLITT